MKAVVYHTYGPPDVLECADIPTPVPGEGDVLIRVRAAAVTPADCVARKGKPLAARSTTGFTRPKKPVLGTELAGEVTAVGDGVTHLYPGDRVMASTGAEYGAHAEYIRLPETAAVTTLPSNASFDEAVALIDGGLTALPFLREHAGIESGMRILVIGASGAVGSAAVQVARQFDAHVTGVCSTANVDLVRSLGAEQVIDYTKEDVVASGGTYDIIFDTVGSMPYRRYRRILSADGVYLCTVLSLNILLQTLRSAMFGRQKAKITFAGLRGPAAKLRDMEFLRERFEAGSYRTLMDRSYTLEEAVAAHTYVDSGRKKGSVLIHG